MATLFSIDTFDKSVEFYPYRTARLKDIFCTVEDIGMSELADIKRDLASHTTRKFDVETKTMVDCHGVNPDNHVIWKVGELAYWFNDGNVYVGTQVVICNY